MVLETAREAACCRLLSISEVSQISFLPKALGGRLCNQTGLHVQTHLCTSRSAGYCQSGQTVLLVPARKVVFCPAEKKTSFFSLQLIFSGSELFSSVSILWQIWPPWVMTMVQEIESGHSSQNSAIRHSSDSLSDAVDASKVAESMQEEREQIIILCLLCSLHCKRRYLPLNKVDKEGIVS